VLSYLDAVKLQFLNQPDVYDHCLHVMKDVENQLIHTPGMIERVSYIVNGPLRYLVQDFNTFLPPGYCVGIYAQSKDLITVTTPMCGSLSVTFDTLGPT